MRKSVPWLAGSLALVITVVVLSFVAIPASSQSSLAPGLRAGEITYGPQDADVVVIEYSDFQCQYCAGYSEMLRHVQEKYQDRVLFVFRFFPLSNHPYGMISAQAAYAAHQQGRFWEMHDLLYEGQQDWGDASDPVVFFQSYAAALGLNEERFNKDLGSEATRAFVETEVAEGEQAGVNHTPWFIINDTSVSFRTEEELQALIEAEL